jgi:hypothetical protein
MRFPSVLAFAIVVALSASMSAQSAVTAPIGVYVFTAQPAGLVPFDLKDREESVRHLLRSLNGKLPKKIAALSTLSENADVMVEVLGRKADGDDIALHLRVRVGEDTLNVDGVNDDGHWSDAANDGAKKIAEWLNVNREQIQARRRR